MKKANTPVADDHTVCLNCGFHATHNFCAQCGQQNHLHKETFLGLIGHFVAHYFHYDSKFWKTLKALWFAPGQLSKEYWEGKRARYIPPISLYIFISAVYFICYFSFPKYEGGISESTRNEVVHQADSVELGYIESDTVRLSTGKVLLTKRKSPGALDAYFEEKIYSLKNGDAEKIAETFKHNFPKLFFFTIPVMAMIMRLLFVRRKGCYFVQHAIFCLHIHSFFFSILLLGVINPFNRLDKWFSPIIAILGVVYFITASVKAYGIGYRRAIFNTFITGFGYLLFFGVAVLAAFLFIIHSL